MPVSYQIIISRSVGEPKLVTESVKVKKGRGIFEHRTRQVYVANGTVIRDDLNQIVYMHPDDVDALKKEVAEFSKKYNDDLFSRTMFITIEDGSS